MRDLREAKELLIDALEILEERITSAVKPADAPVEVCSNRAQTVGFNHTLADLTDDKLRELMCDMAAMINGKGYPLSIPLPKAQATAFCGVLKGDKVYLRLTCMYDVRLDKFVAVFNCMTCEPLAVEAAS